MARPVAEPDTVPKPRFHVYADMNCPFCYALNERIYEQDLSIYCDWRPIQHSPTTSSSHSTFDSLCELASEVSEVRRRSPATEIAIPPVRPNSALASEYIAETWRIDPEKAVSLRLLIYRALWRDGLDISRHETLTPLLREVGIDAPTISQATRDNLEQWQREWEQGDFDRNIPVTLAEDGNRMIGFPEQAELDAFLCHRCDVSINEFAAACIMKPRQSIVLLERDIEAIQQFFTSMKFHDVSVVDSDEALQESITTSPPDMIVMNLDIAGPTAPAIIRRIRLDPATQGSPVIALTSNQSSDEEVVLFEAGAVDYISRPVHDLVLQARLNLHLERKRSKDLLDRMARYDELTEILNRRSFNVSLQAEWGRSMRNKTPVALLMIDVDLFKKYNDRYGHGLGDQCLRQVAKTLQESLKRPSDQLARYGGEEFVVILPETDENGAETVARCCCRNMADKRIPHDDSDIASHVTISVGMATAVARQNRAPEGLLQEADRALYAAKHAGRNRVCLA